MRRVSTALTVCFATAFGCTDDRLSLGRPSDLNGSSASSGGRSVGEPSVEGESGSAIGGAGGVLGRPPPTESDAGHAGQDDSQPLGNGVAGALDGRGGNASESAGLGGGESAGDRASDGGAGSGGTAAGSGAGSGGASAGSGAAGGSLAAGAGGGSRAAVCGNGALEAPEKCDDGNLQATDGCSAACQIEAGFACAGTPSACSKNPSCVGLPKICGPTHAGDCCASSLIPHGSFYRGNTALYPTAYPATVSDFRLDIYEVTLGRFRKFVAAYAQNMIADGAGKNPNNPADPGWDANRWNPHLYADGAALVASFNNPTQITWTATPLSALDETRPIDFVDWFTAEAFCIWDGGRLPTYAEWDYAAAGGAEQRTYPWGNQVGTGNVPAVTICSTGSNGSPLPCYVRENIAPVGSAPAGNGKWGQADLAGNLQEWLQDAPFRVAGLGYVYGPVPCNDCSYLEQTNLASDGIENRSFVGGDYGYIPPNPSYFYQYFRADHHSPYIGMRCARAQ